MKKQKLFEYSALVCLVVLAASILLLCAIPLRVKKEERAARAVEFAYARGARAQEITPIPELGKNEYGSIERAYLLDDGNYLVKSTGEGGFKSGSVTVWTALACTGSEADGSLTFHGIKRVSYHSDERQSYLTRVKSNFYTEFTLHDSEVLNGKRFTSFLGSDGIYNLATGASYSSAAIDNAVNAAITWFEKQVLKKEETRKYAFESFIDLESSRVTLADGTLEFELVTKPNSPARAFTLKIGVANGKITRYEILENGSTGEKYESLMPQGIKDGSNFIGKDKAEILALLTEEGALSGAGEGLMTGATKSTLSCIRAIAFALANEELILQNGGVL